MSGTVGDLRSTKGKVVKEGSLKPKDIDKLDPAQRAWSDKVIRALGLTSAGSQGRMVAGAVASAAMVEANGTDQEKATARGLRAQVLAAGTPPWKDTRKALAAGSAKAHLDILSIPANDRKLEAFGGAQTENETFVIKRREGSGADQRAFLCKPAGNPAQGPAPSGGAKGGEVAREALASRAAQRIRSQIGIDVGMPETHVVALDGSLVPGHEGEASVTCSVQEFRPAVGDIKDPARKRAARPEQVAALAVFDTLTLNTDRHSGNILVDAAGNLIPIDQGESFAENNPDGIGRIKGAVSGPQNALLGLPAAHEPFSPAMLKQLKGLDADKYAKGLASDGELIGSAHPSMAGAVTDGAIENARRAALFLKLAVSGKPPLSPAAVQTALGANADELLDPALGGKAFEALAKKVIARFAPAQAVLKQVQTSSDTEYEQLKDKVNQLGWDLAGRGGAPDGEAITDPLLALRIVREGIQRPNNRAQARARLAQLRGEDVSPAEAMGAVLANRLDTINKLIPLLPAASQAAARQTVQLASNRPMAERLEALSLVLEQINARAKTAQQARLAAFEAANRPADLTTEEMAFSNQAFRAWIDARAELQHDRIIDFAATMTGLEGRAAEFLPAAAAEMKRQLQELADALMLKRNPDLTAGLAAAAADDPFTAKQKLRALQAGARTGTMPDKALAQLQAEFDDLRTRFDLASVQDLVTPFTQAMAGRDMPAALKKLKEIKDRAISGQLVPTADEFEALVDDWGVPDDDATRRAALDAIGDGNRAAYNDALTELDRRRVAGDFGRAEQAWIQGEIDRLTTAHAIPPGQTDLAELRKCLVGRGDPARARVVIRRLEALAADGAF